MKVAIFNNLHVAIQQTEHLEPGPVQLLARWFNCKTRDLRKQGMETDIHWAPGQIRVPRNEYADHQLNLLCEGCRHDTLQEGV